MLYYKRTGGGYSQVNPEETPLTAAEYAAKYEEVTEAEFLANVKTDIKGA